MSFNPALDLATYMASSSQGNLGTLGRSVLVGPVRPISNAVPASAVFVLPTGGPAAMRQFDLTSEVRWPTIQIRVRSTEYAAGQLKADTIYETLQSSTVPSYLDCVFAGPPTYIGQDQEADLYHWSLNARLAYNST